MKKRISRNLSDLLRQSMFVIEYQHNLLKTIRNGFSDYEKIEKYMSDAEKYHKYYLELLKDFKKYEKIH